MLRDVGLGPIASIFHSRENVRFRVNFGNAGLLPLLVICAFPNIASTLFRDSWSRLRARAGLRCPERSNGLQSLLKPVEGAFLGRT